MIDVVVPSLGEILKAYSKEVIRQQPENIFEFSARYFAQLDQNEEEFEAGSRYESDMSFSF